MFVAGIETQDVFFNINFRLIEEGYWQGSFV